MPLTDSQLKHLLGFVGYGTLTANTWFIGMEEGGGGEANILARLNFKAAEDCAEAHRQLGITRFHIQPGSPSCQPKVQRTWGRMAHLMLLLEGKEPTTESRRLYQAERLGRTHGDTLLMELMPLPKRSLREWG